MKLDRFKIGGELNYMMVKIKRNIGIEVSTNGSLNSTISKPPLTKTLHLSIYNISSNLSSSSQSIFNFLSKSFNLHASQFSYLIG